MSASQITQLRVGDESFLVASMIERCPKSMMLRELVRNAIEAAQTAPAGERRVELAAIDIDGVPKLAIWNSGRGMDADELFRMCDIASSIRKQHSLEANFGMGAKVASLPSNRHGMRYRSCRDGRVHEVTIGQRDGVYGRLRRAAPGSDRLQDVLEVTDEARAEGRPLDGDWTEVVLLGNRPDQNTLSDPYDGHPRMAAHWIAEELHRKFFRLPADVELILQAGANISGQPHRFRSLSERLDSHYARHEHVAASDGTLIHYIHDAFLPNDPNRTGACIDAPYFIHGFGGLIYKDEIYDVAWHHAWLQIGPIFGVPFCGRNVSIFVEFPDGFPVLPDGYRQFLRHRDGLQGQVFLRGHAAQVLAHRPAWLVELMAQNAPDNTVSRDIAAGLSRLLSELRVPRRTREVAAPPKPAAPRIPNLSGEPGKPAPKPQPAPPDSRDLIRDDDNPDAGDFEPAPQIIMLRENGEIQARGLVDRGARYYPETHQLFVNCAYPSVTAMRSLLEREFSWADDQEAVRRGALLSAEQSLVERVGRMLVFALSKYGTWGAGEMQHALSTQALTLAADDYYPSLPAARAALRAALRLRQLETPVPS